MYGWGGVLDEVRRWFLENVEMDERTFVEFWFCGCVCEYDSEIVLLQCRCDSFCDMSGLFVFFFLFL